eukprot:10767-Heterococcus_DN1.PRE.2
MTLYTQYVRTPQAKRRLTLANAPGALAAAAAAMQSVVTPAAASQKPRQVLKLLSATLLQNSAGSAAGLDGLGSEDEEDADNDNDNDADNDSQDEGQDQQSAVDQLQQQQADGDGTGTSSCSGYANSSSATAAVAAGERKARWLRKRAATQVSSCISYCVLHVAAVVVSRVWPLSYD